MSEFNRQPSVNFHSRGIQQPASLPLTNEQAETAESIVYNHGTFISTSSIRLQSTLQLPLEANKENLSPVAEKSSSSVKYSYLGCSTTLGTLEELPPKSDTIFNAIAPSEYPEAPSLPCLQVKKYLIHPIKLTGRYNKPVWETNECFNLDCRELKLLADDNRPFQVEIRLTQLDMLTRCMEKYGIPTVLQVNHHRLDVPDFKKTPQLNPAIPLSSQILYKWTNQVRVKLWTMNTLPQNKELFLSIAIVEKLSDTAMLEVVLQRPPIQVETTKAKIKRITENCNDIMENGAYMEISLMCPIGKSRMRYPGRADTCSHLVCFDVETFLHMSKVAPTWKCPICWVHFNYDDVRIDGFFQGIINSSGKDIEKVLVPNPQGIWKPISNNIKLNVTNTSTSTESKAEDSVMDADENGNELTTVSTKRRQSVEIIFEKPVKAKRLVSKHVVVDDTH